MNRSNILHISIVIIAACSLTACQGSTEKVSNTSDQPAVNTVATAAKPGPAPASTSPGKITAPISFDYSIIGNPIVGQAVRINLQISSPLNDRTITVQYRVDEAGSLTFPETQVQRIALLPLADATLRSQQVTVVPQREGRLYLVVSAEVDTDSGTMIRSMSIPIQVGRAPRVPTVNGELVEGPDGEVGISMPAQEP